MNRFLAISIILMSVILFSCIKEEFDTARYDGSLNLETGLAAPIGYSHVGIEKYLQEAAANNELKMDASGFLSLNYSSQILSATAGELLSLTPVSQSFSMQNTSGATVTLAGADPPVNLSESVLIPLNLNLAGARIDSILMESGSLGISTPSPNVSGSVILTFPGVRVNGNALTRNRNLQQAAENYDLTAAILIPEQDSIGNYYLRCVLNITLTAPSGPVANNAELFGLLIDFNSPAFETLFGNFYGLILDLPVLQINPGIFSQFLEGHFDFFDPRFKLLFSNSFGIPIGIAINQFEITDRQGLTTALTGAAIPDAANPKIINYPALEEEGLVTADSLVFSKDNSNLPALLEANPNVLHVSAAALVDSIPSGSTGFIRSDSRLDITAVLDLPLWGKAEFLVMQDTLAFDYLSTSLPAPEEIERAIIRISATNGFPVSVFPQAYFLDANGVLLDSLFEEPQQLQGASDKNGDGKADPEKMAPLDIDLPRDKIEMLQATRYVITRGRVTTSNYPAEDVKFYSGYSLDYSIGLIVQLKTNPAK